MFDDGIEVMEFVFDLEVEVGFDEMGGGGGETGTASTKSCNTCSTYKCSTGGSCDC